MMTKSKKLDLVNYKKEAALKALEYVKSGMVLGIGTGSTTKYFIDALGEALKNGSLKDIKGVATSIKTEEYASGKGIPMVDINHFQELDLAVDGADEIDGDLNLIKGLGRALLREKIVESYAKQFVVIADYTKAVRQLGKKRPLPIEIVPFGWLTHIRWLEALGCKVELWLEKEKPVVTDNHNYIVKCWFEDGIEDPHTLAVRIKQRTGVVEHGLFINMADVAIIVGKEGVQIKNRSD